MLSLSDVVRLPYTPDLTLAGIADTCRKRARAAYPSQPVILENLHASVASTASELAFRRYLDQQHVAYQLRKSPTPNNPDQRVLELAGNRCEWICPLISNHSDIQQLGEDANRLLALPVRLPRYTFIPSLAGDEDRMIFSFVIGLVTRTSRELEKTRTGQQPEYLIHFFPKPTFGGQYWTPLGQIELQANCRQPVGLECAGLNGERIFQSEEIVLEPGQTSCLQKDYYSLVYVHLKEAFDVRVEINNQILSRPYSIEPAEWQNIWVYGTNIYVAGYLPRRELRYLQRRRANSNRNEIESLTGKYFPTVADLHPITNLFH